MKNELCTNGSPEPSKRDRRSRDRFDTVDSEREIYIKPTRLRRAVCTLNFDLIKKRTGAMKPLIATITALLFGFSMIGFAQSDDQTDIYIEQITYNTNDEWWDKKWDEWDGSLDIVDLNDIPSHWHDYFKYAKSLYNTNKGLGNSAYIYQKGNENTLSATQIGSGHFFFGVQDGDDNVLNSTLFGHDNMSIMLQRGSDNTANLSFDGDWLGGIIIQDGNNNIFNESDRIVFGVGESEKLFKVIQTGNDNRLDLIDNTGFALPMEIRQSGGARLMLINGPIPVRMQGN